MSIVEGAALSEASRDSKIAEKTFVRFERAHLFADKWTAEALKNATNPIPQEKEIGFGGGALLSTHLIALSDTSARWMRLMTRPG